MNTISAVILSVVLFLAGGSGASINEGTQHSFRLRAWKHPEYLRIVIEGPDNAIAKGTAVHRGDEVVVTFPETEIHVTRKTRRVAYRIEHDAFIFNPGYPSRIKTFIMKNPDRLIVDLYETDIKQSIRDGTDKAVTEGDAKKEQKSAALPGDGMSIRSDNDNTSSERATAEKGDEEKPPADRKEAKPGEVRKENETTNTAGNGDTAKFIPESYKRLWGLLISGKPYSLIKTIPMYKPRDREDLAAYHFLYGEAYFILENYFDAVKHFRLAYIYALAPELKELALLRRGEVHLKLNLLYEARADYRMFIEQFPSSDHIENVHMNLATVLSRIGMHEEAIGHYEKAGGNDEALFRKANALQKMHRIEEARRAYNEALLVNSKYPEKSPETYYLIGENMRMAGELKEAKRHLSIMRYGRLGDKALLSLGLIALEEGDTEEAVRKFKLAHKSRDWKIRVQSLFHLSRAYAREGRTEEAIAGLEKIRMEYINTNMYKDVLLELAKLYRREGNTRKSISFLKELVYGKEPPPEAFEQLESILINAGDGSSPEGDGLRLAELWKEVGQWMLDPSREDFLLDISSRLRKEREEFLELCTWIQRNGSAKARAKASVHLADFYAESGDMRTARKYLEQAGDMKAFRDDVLRADAKIEILEEDYTSALGNIMDIRKIENGDLHMLALIITRLENEAPKIVSAAVSFFEETVNSSEWDADVYVQLADILFTNGEEGKAHDYYRKAYRKKPENEWATYRAGAGIDPARSKEMFGSLAATDSLIGRLSRAKLIEMNLKDRVREVY